MNELVYHHGGTLVLDEAFKAQPSAATITIRTLGNAALSSLGDFDDIEDEACDLDDLVLTMPAANSAARLFVPSATAGTIPSLTDTGYRLLLNRGGRLRWLRVSEYTSSMGAVTSFRTDAPVPYAVEAGDRAYGIRVSYPVDWSAVTDDFVGRVKAVWSVTVDGTVHHVTRIYDVVKQVFEQPATWEDVLALRPDADTQLSHVPNKEVLVAKAWDDIRQTLNTMGIRHNLIVPDESTALKDATVLQVLYNLTAHASLQVPNTYQGLGDAYLDRLSRDKERALALLSMPVDENEDQIIDGSEEVKRNTVWFRSAWNHRRSTDR